MKTGYVRVMLLGAVTLLAACESNPFKGFGFGGSDDDAAGVTVGDGAITESSIAFFQTSVGDRVLFAVDQSTLNDAAVAILDGQAEWLLANTAMTATVEGHADEQGTREYNMALSARRANAVYNYLIGRGVSPDRLTTIPFGKDKPLAICSEEECWSKNRRAVTVVAGGIGS